MATTITVTSGLIYGVSSAAMISNAPIQVAPTFVSDDRIGALEASRVVWCVMPTAWQRACENPTTKTVRKLDH
jgi:hypothetical protein